MRLDLNISNQKLWKRQLRSASLSPRLAPASSCTSHLTSATTWPHTVLTAGTLAHPPSITNATSVISGIRDAPIVDWFPHSVPFPKVGTNEYLQQTATDMLVLLQDSTTPPIPSLTYGSSVTNTYIQIAQILKRATASPIPPAPLYRWTHTLYKNRGCSHSHHHRSHPRIPPSLLRYAQPQRRLHSRPVHPSQADKAATRSDHQADTPMAH
jgi:hypothetical protein